MADSENTPTVTPVDISSPENDSFPINSDKSEINKLIEVSFSEQTGGESLGRKKTKIDILLKPTGDAPIMKKKKWSVSLTQNMAWIVQFMRQYLKLDPSESLFLYINQAFSPSPDQTISNLYECFGSDGRLVFHYARSQAWG